MAKQSLSKLSKEELYQLAPESDVPGRSKMDKDELVAALSDGSAESGQASEGGRPATTRRSIWSGAITFGLITIPVGLYTATEDRDISFHLLLSQGQVPHRVQAGLEQDRARGRL